MKKSEFYILVTVVLSLASLAFIGKQLSQIHKIYNSDFRSSRLVENESHQSLQQVLTTYIPDGSVQIEQSVNSKDSSYHDDLEVQRNMIEGLNESNQRRLNLRGGWCYRFGYVAAESHRSTAWPFRL